jgi:RHS repeat-associated protein
MKTTSIRAKALACALLGGTALCGVAAPASAQVTSPTYRNFDPNGVDLVKGDFLTSFPEGSIGSGEAELTLLRMLGATGSNGTQSSSQWDHILLNIVSSGTYVDFGSRNDKFPGAESRGASLAGSGSSYQYRSPDGTVIAFTDPSPGTGDVTNFCGSSGTHPTCILLPTTITSPDGKVVNINYDFWSLCITTGGGGGPPYDDPDPEDPVDCTHTPRIASVTNSYGYEIRFAYASAGGTSSSSNPPSTFHRRTGASFYNTNASSSALASVSYSYPSTGVTDVTDQGGRVWRVTSSATNYAIRRPGASSNTTSASLSSGVVTSVTKEGVTTNYSRSVSGSTATMVVTNALSQATTIVSNLVSGRPTSITDPLSHSTSFTYDTSDRLKRVTQHEGNYVEHTYDARGNITQTVAVPKGGTGPTILTSASFDSTCANPVTCNRPNSTTDARGNVTDYTYDSTHGGVLTVTEPAATTGAVRPQTRYSYTQTNGEYRLTGISRCQTTASCTGTADEVKTAVAYDANGNLYWIAAGNGSATLVASATISFDAIGNPVAVDGPLSGTADTSRTRYNAARQVIGTVSADPDGSGALKHRAVRNTYDSSTGLLTKVEQGNVNSQSDTDWAAFSPAQAMETSYDSNARPIVTRLTSGSTVYGLGQTSYDALGRPECSAQRMNPAVFATVTATSACSLGTQGTGAGDYGPDRISKTLYDAVGRVYQAKTAVGITGEEANEVTRTFTANGQVESVTDAEGNKTTYEYDGHDRLAKTRYPDTTKGAGTSSTTDYEQPTYESLAGGTRTSPLVVAYRNRANQTANFGYDALGRQISKDLPGSEPDVTYGYDLLGRLTSASQTGHALTFTYDALSRILNQTGPLGTFASEWDIAGRRTKLTWPDTFYVTYDYLLTGEMTAIRENGAASGIGVLATFAYDDLGQRTSFTRGNGAVTSYSHDAVSRLQQFTQDPVGTTHDLTLGFAYNPASQIASTTRSNDAYAWTGHGSGTTSTTSNGLNQIAGWVSTLGHDSKGNVTSHGTFGYAYSSENLLTSMTNSATGAVQASSTFAYDPLMRLAVIDSSNSAFDASLGYDGQEIVYETLSSNRTRRYIFGPDADEPLMAYLIQTSGTTRNWYHADEKGSIIGQSNDSGTMLGVTGFDEYGVGTGTSRFHYTGQYWLGDSFHYFKARIYDPRLGRFLQPDPIGYGDGMNRYAYVKGDPVNSSDPSGMCELVDVGYSWYTPGGEYLGPAPGKYYVLRNCAGDLGGSTYGSGSGVGGPDNGGGSTPGAACAADPSCVATVDTIVVTGYREKKFNGLRWDYLPWPKEPIWFVYPDFSVVGSVTVVEKDRCGQARNRSVAPRPGFIAMIHAHSADSPGWPGSADISNAVKFLVYGMFSEENGKTGVWRMGPGSDSVRRVTGDRPTDLDLSRSGSNIKDPVPTEARCKK